MNEGYFYIIPAELAESTINSKTILLFGILSNLSNKTGNCYPSNAFLAKKLNISTTSISLKIKKLITLGYLQSKIDQENGNKRTLTPIYKNLKTSLRKLKDPYLRKLKHSNKHMSNKLSNKTSIANNNLQRFNKDIYSDILNEYQHLKGIELKGKEFLPPKKYIKDMLLSDRTPDQIKACMKWLAGGSEDWMKNWVMATVAKKMPEYIKIHNNKNKPVDRYHRKYMLDVNNCDYKGSFESWLYEYKKNGGI